MRGNKHLYLGRAGQLYIVAEFLLQDWNAAIPEIDTGDDVFVVQDKIGLFKRIQVKTITGTKRKNGYSAKFIIPYTKISTPVNPELVFFLLIRHSNEWVNYFIIERQKLHDYVDLNNVGSKNSKLNTVQLYVSFNEKLKSAKCSKNDFSFHIKDWSKFR